MYEEAGSTTTAILRKRQAQVNTMGAALEGIIGHSTVMQELTTLVLKVGAGNRISPISSRTIVPPLAASKSPPLLQSSE